MQDRFNIRFWDKKKKKMYYDLLLFFDYMDCMNDTNLIPMQCTGLKDKNGKLIYEGDIIEVQYLGAQIALFRNEYSDQPKNERFAVIYDDTVNQYVCTNYEYRKTCEVHSLDFYKIQINTENKLYEVIGNVHKNPELLEEIEV